MKQKILVIENHSGKCETLFSLLEDDTIEIQYLDSRKDTIAQIAEDRVCLIFLDFGSYSADDLSLIRTSQRMKQIPIVAMTHQSSTTELAELFHAGVVVCVEQAVDFSLLTAQIRALIQLFRESVETQCTPYTMAFGNELVIIPEEKQVLLNGENLSLTHREFQLLYCLASHSQQVFSKEQLYQQVWNHPEKKSVDDAVKSCIKTLRKKLAPAGKEYIQTLHGIGYCFEA